MLFRIIILAAILVNFIGCSILHSQIVTQPKKWSELQKRLEPHYRFVRPNGNGPFPAVLIVPGCSGFNHPRAPNAYNAYVERLRALGNVVFVVDYVSAEGIAEACGGRLSSAKVAEYVSAAAGHVAGMPLVNRAEIRIIGWSLGGGGVLSALDSIDTYHIPIRSACIQSAGMSSHGKAAYDWLFCLVAWTTFNLRSFVNNLLPVFQRLKSTLVSMKGPITVLIGQNFQRRLSVPRNQL